MHSCRSWLARVCLVLGCVLAASPAARASGERPERTPLLVQPFLITFDRHDSHVIVLLEDHPEYDAVEAMITRRPGQPPLIRAIINRRDGFQIDHFNDPELARQRAALFTGRQSVYRPIWYGEFTVEGVPRVGVLFVSYRGEPIFLDFRALTPPQAELGGPIFPSTHGVGVSLPVMWGDAAAFARPDTVLRIGGVPQALRPGPVPGSSLGFYTSRFLIGVFREGRLALQPVRLPRRLAVGEWAVYWDFLGNWHVFEIIAIEGERLTVHRTTSSPALTEEVLTFERQDGRLRLRSVRATGRAGLGGSPPPAPEGLTLDLSEPGRFTVSIDAHPGLVRGTASFEEGTPRRTWRLLPEEPSWAAVRTVRATVSEQERGTLLIETEVGED